ncbi:hypothetical protein NQ315_015376 [Exocentrus adspersus]|uniref:Tyr recombinase domain-containing protein n=1 Tax=Exocentrus adspersus TaxID=1586481 RepID=A0AAV8VK89_9CUCU|nr:hypothetical protein NQ315_015376 [Exocentrus adspersus]
MQADRESRSAATMSEYSLNDKLFNCVTKTLGLPTIDLFESRLNAKCAKYVSWHADPGSTAVDAFTLPWNDIFFYAFPPFSMIPRVLSKILEDQATGILTAASLQPDPFPGCREAVSRAYLMKKMPQVAVETIIASLSDSTLKQYNSSLSKWWLYCSNNSISKFEARGYDVIGFLQEELSKGASYSTINTQRSALGLLLSLSPDEEKLLRRFLKGVFRIKPCFPRYTSTWDPNVVLAYLETLYPLSSLSIEQLTLKLCTLLALTSAQRVQTLAKIKVKDICIKSDNQIEITISSILKTSAPDRTQPTLIFPTFNDKPALCVASTIIQYLHVTKDFRSEHKNQEFLLIIKKPIHPATTQTISRWIKTPALIQAFFKSHSTRHASTSAAARGGLNIETIRKAAGWTEKSKVFAKFYNRTVITTPNFATTILELYRPTK